MAGVFDIDINDLDGNNVELDAESDDDVIEVEVFRQDYVITRSTLNLFIVFSTARCYYSSGAIFTTVFVHGVSDCAAGPDLSH